MDFTSVYLELTPGEARTVQVCIFVLEWMEDGRRMRSHVCYLCDDAATNANDYFFLLHACLKLFADSHVDQRFDSIHVWSDGGPHHFKTRYCQWMWWWLSTHRFSQKSIIHNFFAAYHGHSLADSFAAAIKRVLRSQYHTSQLQRFCHTVIAVYWGSTNAAELAALLAHACSDTQVHVFPTIDRDPTLKPHVSHIPHIKSKHCFVYANGNCAAASDSSGAGSQPFSFTQAARVVDREHHTLKDMFILCTAIDALVRVPGVFFYLESPR